MVTMSNRSIEGLKRLEERLSRYGLPWRHEKDIVSNAIEYIERLQEKVGDHTNSEEIEVYMSVDCDLEEKLVEPLVALMTRVWEAGGHYTADTLRVRIKVEYVPENK